jgi:hypothetical protein
MIGAYANDAGGRAFSFYGGIYSLIGPPGYIYSEAFGVNDLGQVVGTYYGSDTDWGGFQATPTN